MESIFIYFLYPLKTFWWCILAKRETRELNFFLKLVKVSFFFSGVKFGISS